jgi:Zinc finger, C3HC4 type (RING finger)
MEEGQTDDHTGRENNMEESVLERRQRDDSATQEPPAVRLLHYTQYMTPVVSTPAGYVPNFSTSDPAPNASAAEVNRSMWDTYYRNGEEGAETRAQIEAQETQEQVLERLRATDHAQWVALNEPRRVQRTMEAAAPVANTAIGPRALEEDRRRRDMEAREVFIRYSLEEARRMDQARDTRLQAATEDATLEARSTSFAAPSIEWADDNFSQVTLADAVANVDLSLLYNRMPRTTRGVGADVLLIDDTAVRENPAELLPPIRAGDHISPDEGYGYLASGSVSSEGTNTGVNLGVIHFGQPAARASLIRRPITASTTGHAAGFFPTQTVNTGPWYPGARIRNINDYDLPPDYTPVSLVNIERDAPPPAEAALCCICLVNAPNIVLLQCGHACLCTGCSVALIGGKEIYTVPCPLCKSLIGETIGFIL